MGGTSFPVYTGISCHVTFPVTWPTTDRITSTLMKGTRCPRKLWWAKLLGFAYGKFNLSNTQEVTQNWTLWNLFYGQRCLCIRWKWTAEGHEFNFIMIQQLSDIQSCLNVFLNIIAPKNLGIDIKIIKFESIVMDLRSFGGVGGHYWRHIGFLCYIYRPTSFFMILMCSLPPKT